MRLEGCGAVVVGGARGIGKDYSRALLEKKAKVCICDILEDAGKETVEEFQKQYGQDFAVFKKVDARHQEEITEAFKAAREQFGRLDVALNNVGVIDELNWQRQVDLNLGTAIRMTLAALEVMGKDKGGAGGALVHTASNAGLVPAFYGPVYSATKSAIIMYSRAYTTPVNFQRHGVRMLCVCPTFVATAFLAEGANPSQTLNLEVLQERMQSNIAKLIPVEAVSKTMIDMLEDDSMNGVAAQMLSETPIFHYKD